LTRYSAWTAHGRREIFTGKMRRTGGDLERDL